MQETKIKKLKGYGTVDEGLEHSLDPLLEEMTDLINKTLKTLTEAGEVRSPRRKNGLW